MIGRRVHALPLLLLLALGACGSEPSADAQAPAPAPVSVATTAPQPDPGVVACRAVARRVKAGQPPSDGQRVVTWTRLQASQHEDLRSVGIKLEAAWTTGSLAEQMDANVNARMACAVHGVEVPGS